MRILKLITLFTLTIHSVHADNEEEVSESLKRFYKCSSLFLEKYPRENDPRVLKIKEGKLTGLQACRELYESVSLNKEGLISPSSDESLKLVDTFQKFYNSWIKLKNMNFETQDFSNTDYHDVNEGPYHLTYNLITGNHYGETFQGQSYFKAKRKSQTDKRYFFDRDINGHRFEVITPSNKWKTGSEEIEDEKDGDYGNQGPVTFIEPPELVETGQLIGIVKDYPLKNKISYRSMKKEYYPNQPKGAGVIGTIPYLIANSSALNTRPSSTFDYDRRWATSVFRDYLCLDLPLLKTEDVVQYVNKKSQTSFLTNEKCMKCHVTMDFMGATIRNQERYNTGDDDGHFSVVAVYTHPVTDPKRFTDTFPESYANLFKTQPDGILYFRDIKGNLVKDKVIGLNELGKALSKTDAPYYCAVKKHFEFLTGYQVPMSAFKDYYQRNKKSEVVTYLANLSEDFKKHGNIKKLLTAIIQSPYFLE